MKSFARMLPEAVCFIAIVMLVGWLASCVCGCATQPVADPKYPEYEKWWASGAIPRQVIEFDGPYANVSYVIDVVGRDGTTNSIPVEVTPI